MSKLRQVLLGAVPFSRTGLILVIVFGIAYPLIAILFFAELNNFVATFALLPVVFAGWYFGRNTAIVASIAATMTNIMILTILTTEGKVDLVRLAVGSLFIVITGIVVGWAGERIQELQIEIVRRQTAEQQAQDLAAAAQALKEGITAVNSNLPLEEILDQILLYLSQVITYDAANVMLIEGEIGRIFRHRGYSENETPHLHQRQLPLSQAPNLQEMITNRQPIVIPDTENYSGWLSNQATSWVRSYMGAPIYTRNRVIGFLNVNSTLPNYFNQSHAERLQIFADQVALAIYNAQLLSQARQQTERLIILLDTARAAAATLNLDKILHLVAEQIVRTLQVDSCNLSRWDRHADVVVSWVEYSQGSIKYPEVAGTVYQLSEYPLTRHVLISGEPMTIFADDPAADPHEVALMKERDIKSVIMMPLATPDRVVGLLEMADYKQEREFTADEMALCQALLDQAAIFIVNANLFEETRRQTQQLAILNELSHEMNMATEVPDICQLVANQLHATFGFKNVMILVTDHTSRELLTVSNINPHDQLMLLPPHHQPFSEDLINQVMQTGKALIINDPQQYPGFLGTNEMAPYSEAIFPLIANRKTLGVLKIDSEKLNAFDTAEINLLTTVASQLATTLEKARLFAETRQRAQQLESLRQASLSVTSSLQLPRVLQAILGATLGMISLEGVHIFIYDQEVLTFGAVLWEDGRPDTPFSKPRPGGFTYTVVQQGQLIIVPNIQQHPLFADAPPEWQGALAGFPLKIGERVVGVMTVSRTGSGVFTENDLQTLHLLADHAAIAIENARLYKQTQEEIEERKVAQSSLRQRNLTLELLTELSRAIAVPLKINLILNNIIQLAGEALDLTSMYICDWNEETGLSSVLAEYISDKATLPEKLSDLGVVYHLKEDFDDDGNWLRSPEGLEIIQLDDPDLFWNERAHMDQHGVQTVITVPLWVGDHAIGYLEGWESRYKRQFTQYEIEVLQAISRQVAMGVYNAILYESVRENEERFRLIFELAPAGICLVGLDGYFQQANQALCNMIGYTAEELTNLTIGDISHPDDIVTNQHLQQQLLRGEISHFSLEQRYIHNNGDPIDILLQVTLLMDDDGNPLHFIEQSIDITQRKEAEEQLRHNAFHDELTNLPNRALFLDHLQRAINHTTRHGRYAFAVLFLDLDRFKVINDSLGHATGDELLKLVAQRLLTCVRPGDTVARFGGDEFTVLLDGLTHIGEAHLMAEQIQQVLNVPIFLDDHELGITSSIGITINAATRPNPEDYIRDADTAMYRAKEQGGGRFEVFDDQMHQLALDRLRLETELRQAVQQQELEVYYQPVVSLADGRLSKVEALLRWSHAQRGFISPGQFIPLAEETGLIHPISQWLLETVCKQAKIWYDMGYSIRVAINVSVRQFQYQDLPTLVHEALTQTGLPASALELEITESIAMLNDDFSTIPLRKLSDMGVTISIDDFGTGYSSLSRLKSLPIHVLKIDRSFITDVIESVNDRAIVTAIITMAHGLQLKVVAEGVETIEQLNFLREQKCDEVQGYIFNPPTTANAISKLLSQGNLLSVKTIS